MFLKYPAKRAAIPIRTLIPSVITTIALCCGLAAIHFALKAHWDRAVVAVALSAVFDTLDGRAARLLKSTSRFGAVLDSLSDFCSFGVAPAVILHQWLLRDEAGLSKAMEGLAMAAVMTYALCAALRLARFTAARPPKKSNVLASKFFVGMPSPAAAGAVLLPVVIEVSPSMNWALPPWLPIGYTAFVAWLMVSRRPMFSFKKVRIYRGLVVPLMIAAGLLVFTASRDPWMAGGIVAFGYLLTLPLAHVVYTRLRAQTLATQYGAVQGGAAQEGAAQARAAGDPPILEIPPEKPAGVSSE